MVDGTGAARARLLVVQPHDNARQRPTVHKNQAHDHPVREVCKSCNLAAQKRDLRFLNGLKEGYRGFLP